MSDEHATTGLLDADELQKWERQNAAGISSQEIIALFQSRGIRLSEATFRKYVQLGLLPTSRRVGRKGKHRGSRGLYPIGVLRRINLIKRLMDQGLTLEEIRDSFVSLQNDIERLGQAFDSLFSSFGERLSRLEARGETVDLIVKDVATTRRGAAQLLKQIEKLGSRLAVSGPTALAQEPGGNP